MQPQIPLLFLDLVPPLTKSRLSGNVKKKTLRDEGSMILPLSDDARNFTNDMKLAAELVRMR
jgi:hypothetical protein